MLSCGCNRSSSRLDESSAPSAASKGLVRHVPAIEAVVVVENGSGAGSVAFAGEGQLWLRLSHRSEVRLAVGPPTASSSLGRATASPVAAAGHPVATQRRWSGGGFRPASGSSPGEPGGGFDPSAVHRAAAAAAAAELLPQQPLANSRSVLCARQNIRARTSSSQCSPSPPTTAQLARESSPSIRRQPEFRPELPAAHPSLPATALAAAAAARPRGRPHPDPLPHSAVNALGRPRPPLGAQREAAAPSLCACGSIGHAPPPSLDTGGRSRSIKLRSLLEKPRNTQTREFEHQKLQKI